MLNTKKKISRQIQSSLLILVSLFWSFSVLLTPQPVQACSWITQITCEIFNVSYANIVDTINGILLGALKNAAIKVVSQNIIIQVGGGGSGGGPLFITDWRSALYSQPSQRAKGALNDFFTLSTRGQSYTTYNPSAAARNSSGWKINAKKSSGIAGASTERAETPSDPTVLAAATGTSDINWLTGEGVLASDIADIRNNYPQYLKESAKKSVLGNDCVVNIQEYGPVAKSFKSNDALMQNCNNVWQYSSSAQRTYDNAFTMESVLAQTQGIAYSGYNAVVKNGQIVTPGINISSLIDSATKLPGEIMAGVKNFSEFAAAAATSAVNGAVNSLVQSGIASVNGAIQTKTGGFISIGGSVGGYSGGSYSNGGYSTNPTSVSASKIPSWGQSNRWQSTRNSSTLKP